VDAEMQGSDVGSGCCFGRCTRCRTRRQGLRCWMEDSQWMGSKANFLGELLFLLDGFVYVGEHDTECCSERGRMEFSFFVHEVEGGSSNLRSRSAEVVLQSSWNPRLWSSTGEVFLKLYHQIK